MAKSLGQLAYERDLIKCPNYHDGKPRRPWDALDAIARHSWEKNPTDRGAQSKEDIAAGYRAYNGYVFTESDARRYNAVADRCDAFERAGMAVPEYLLNARHRMFCEITGCNGPNF